MFRQNPPHYSREYEKPNAADGGTGGIYAGGLAPAPTAVQALFFFFFTLMLLYERCAGGKDRRKCQEQAADNRPEYLRDDSCNRGDHSAENESH